MSVSKSLGDKAAIATGSSRGIVAAIAPELARRGAKAVNSFATAGSETAVASIVEEIKAFNMALRPYKEQQSRPNALKLQKECKSEKPCLSNQHHITLSVLCPRP